VTTLESRTQFGSLERELARTRALTEELAAPLSEADQTVQSMPDTSPTKWHRAHTTWFFEAFVLQPLYPGYEPFDPNFGYLFNSYYEAVGDRYPRPHRGMLTRPGPAAIGAYRQVVDEAMSEVMAACENRGVGGNGELGVEAIARLTELGVHHEQQHQELLLMDIKHVLANNLFDTAYAPRPHQAAPDPGPQRWVGHPGGTVEIGFDPEGSDTDGAVVGGSRGPFHFDNEGPRHRFQIPPHQIADRLVTCGEWLAFMADGGYQNPQLWLSDGWYTAQREGWTAPLYWSRSDGVASEQAAASATPDDWQVHTLTGTRPVDPNEPVCHVSFYEADAFATWAGARLPTEFEWEAAAVAGPHTVGAFLAAPGLDGTPTVTDSALHPRGAEPRAASSGDGGSRQGTVRQLFGDCWEWTGSPYRPYPGYRVPEGAVGEYNGKFMINTMVLRGGCAFTPAGHIRPTYRNFFHPHTRWHLSGVRLARD
jgi:ergothioneine biosynthesis protein EgtB